MDAEKLIHEMEEKLKEMLSTIPDTPEHKSAAISVLLMAATRFAEHEPTNLREQWVKKFCEAAQRVASGVGPSAGDPHHE